MITLLIGFLLVLSPPLVPSPPKSDATVVPAFFDSILGEWRGEGQLFGQPTEFEMTWTIELRERFVRLEYSILGERGMDAIAHYRLVEGEPLVGVWVDTRGEILELSATVTDTKLETTWRSSTEQGRTTYELVEADELEVSDHYHDGNDWQPFGGAVYSRRDRSSQGRLEAGTGPNRSTASGGRPAGHRP